MPPSPLEADPEALARAWREQQVFVTRLRATRPRVTQGLVALLALVYLLELAWGADGSTTVLVRMGAMTRPHLLAGEWWRLMSSSVLHGGLLHVSLNGYVLWVLGRGTERLLGSVRFAILYVASALGGALGSGLVLGHVSVGASGAIWGLLGAQAVLAFRPGLVPEHVRPLLRRSAGANLLLNLGVSFLPHVDWVAHVTGGLTGALVIGSGVLLRGLPRLDEPDPASGAGTRLRALALALGALYLGGAGTGLLAGRAWELRGPLTWSERALPELGAVVSLPGIVGAGAFESEGDHRILSFGDEAGPLRISIQRLGVPSGHRPATLDLEREHAELRRQMAVSEEGLELVEPPVTAEHGGRLVTESRSRLSWGASYDVACWIEPPFVWKVEVLTWSDWSERYAEVMSRVVSSLRSSDVGSDGR